MGIIQRIFNTESRTAGTVDFDDGLLQALLCPLAVTRETALQIPTVSGGIDLIANIVSGTPIKLYRDNNGKAEEIRDDYRLPLLNDETGDTLNANEFWHAIILDYYLGKGGYAYINKSRGKIRSLHYVEEQRISVNKNADPIFKEFQFNVGGSVYNPWDFLRILRNTKDGATGIPITAENSRLIAVSYQQLLLEYSMAKRGGNKKGFLKAERKLEQTALDALKDAWKNLYANDKENVVVLNNGIDFKECSDTSAEMQLDENKRTNAGEFAKIFHISPEAISGKAQDINSLAKLAAIPLMKAIECALNRDLLLEKEKREYYFAYDTKELLKGEMKERFDAYKTALDANFMQIDEVRYAEDLEPLGLTWIKLGLQDVLYDPKTKQIYTPNTNQTGAVGNDSGLPAGHPAPDPLPNEDNTEEQRISSENQTDNTLKSDEKYGIIEARSEGNDFIQDPKTGKMNGSRPSGENEKNAGGSNASESDTQEKGVRLTTPDEIRKDVLNRQNQLLEDSSKGIVHAGIYKDAMKHTEKQLLKSIKNHGNQIDEHWRKIQNPEKADQNWKTNSRKQKDGLLKKWTKDMKRNAEQMSIEQAVYKERFENGHNKNP